MTDAQLDNFDAMMDAVCPACSAKIAWHGKVRDRPPCPACGHVMDKAALDKHITTTIDDINAAVDKEMEEKRKGQNG